MAKTQGIEPNRIKSIYIVKIIAINQIEKKGYQLHPYKTLCPTSMLRCIETYRID